MPELPEVEVVRTGLEALLQNEIVQTVQCFRADLRYPLPDFSLLCGMRMLGIERRSKYLLFHFEHPEKHDLSPQCLVWHLGMTGQFHVLDQSIEAAKHEHVRFDFTSGKSLRYRDARRFGYAAVMPYSAWLKHRWYQALGAEPLSDDFSVDTLIRHCQGRKAPIKNIIMNAATVVGVGNIYASEALFLAGISPTRAAGRIAKKRLQALVDAIKQTLAAAIKAGGSSISDFVKVDGKPGYFAYQFNVYGREGEACEVCERKIIRITQAGRSSFYCSSCQH